MLKLAALLVATTTALAATTATATAPDTLVSNSPWWEKVTVTIGGDGKPASCLYQTSLKQGESSDCDIASSQASMMSRASDSKGEVTRITFERRFDPGTPPAKPDLQSGDTLLGGQMMALAIDPHGSVKGCKVVATSGEMQPQYSCDDAQAERFQASLGTGAKTEREGYMTIIVYGHTEHMV